MKLCVVMPAHWSGRLGGAEIQVRYLLRHLRATTNHQVSVICRHASMTEDEGATIHRIKTFRPLARYSYLPDYSSVQGLLRRIDPDVVYSRVGSPLVGFAAHYCRRHRKSLVHHIARLDDVLPRAKLPPQNLIRDLERRIYETGLRQADAVIAQAHYQANLLDQHFNRKPDAVIANYHPGPGECSCQGRTCTARGLGGKYQARKTPGGFYRACATLPDPARYSIHHGWRDVGQEIRAPD